MTHSRWLRLWYGWGVPLACAVLFWSAVRLVVADVNRVPSGSMLPSILPGDRILVNELAFGLRLPGTLKWLARWAEPRRGDVVVFASPADGRRLVKRVIGLPGDRVEMRDHRLWINGRPVDVTATAGERRGASPPVTAGRPQVGEEWLGARSHPVMMLVGEGDLLAFGPVVVPPGRYFVMGDNRDLSLDSRWFGCVDGRRIIGRVSRVVLSLDPARHGWLRRDRLCCRVP